MNATIEAPGKDFKVWMAATLSLLKDGKMGASQARSERIKLARTYSRRDVR